MEPLMRQVGPAPTTPRPHPFQTDAEHDQARRVEAIGRALDNVVEAFVILAEDDTHLDHGDLQRLTAAARRLWMTARSLHRARRGAG